MACLLTDVLLHKGITRVIINKNFTDQRKPATFKSCHQGLIITDKNWIKAVNTVHLIEQLAANTPGFEMDVYFDTAKNILQVYHDSSGYSNLSIEEILNVYQAKKLTSSIWLDFKNLTTFNEKKSLSYISSLRNRYNLKNKMIIESSDPQLLQSFCDSNFYTSYYTPLFNPYLISENELINTIDLISTNLKKYPTSAMSGYYFQYPFLQKYFPSYPLLIWADNGNYSLVGNIFNNMLGKDEQLKVILRPAMHN